MPDDNALPPAVQQRAVDKLMQIIEQIVTLRVTTVIGVAHVDLASAVSLATDTVVTLDGGNEQKVFSTAINMALGDMTQILHPDFETNQALAKMHEDAIAVARAVRADTVTLVTMLAKDLVGAK